MSGICSDVLGRLVRRQDEEPKILAASPFSSQKDLFNLQKRSEGQNLPHYLEDLSVIKLAAAHLFGARTAGHNRNINCCMRSLLHLSYEIIPGS